MTVSMGSGDKLLFLLKTRGRANASALSRQLGISPQAVRERLAQLENDGLVAHEDEVAGRGRPKRFWHLAEKADAAFPDTHAELTVSLISTIHAELGQEALDRLIARRERETAAQYREALAGCATLEDRVAALAGLRQAEGYMAEWQRSPERDGSFLLVENHCPICAAARACQGFCRAELDVFRDSLGEGCTVEREEHILKGARRCTYRIAPKPGP
ncbi:transcriptional regulator [Kaustia mangrovi]|uniref:Transcriptional regulator n=1 Tax=Kaustia mangrovi TaxID=2593653 RepID=A0A7S8C308_9HYPH|nr:metalloregulator ArsR/SmtB family transcription factor [Kaustia mangrovi]QPC42431.1 transcriptional regulator [Kaustia mangrovi]